MSEERVVVTSVVRHSGSEDRSGFVRVVNLANRKIVMKSATVESAFRTIDPNPRGGLRGLRGIAVHGDRLLIANAEKIMIFDLSWTLVGEISHPLMGGVHDILAEADGIWVTCASADMLLKFAWNGDLLADWDWRADESLRAAFGFTNLPATNRAVDYRNPDSLRTIVSNVVHLNSVNRGSEGLLISLGRILSVDEYRKLKLARFMGAVAKSVGVKRRPGKFSELPVPVSRIGNSSSALILRREDGSTKILKKVSDTHVPNHNVIETDGALVYNDTNGNSVVRATDKGEQMAVTIPGAPAFARGLAQLDQHQFLVGSQKPVAIYQVNLQTGGLVTAYPLDGEPNETVFGICILPARFSDPPPEMKSWYALVAASIYGAHQIFTKLASDRVSDGLDGFVVEATAALTIVL